ncbi:MAG: hypothetical protein ACR2LN_02805 [Candidatus Levyibacteriota bacterium]
MNLDYKDLTEQIRKVFIEKDSYLFDKYTPEFFVKGKLLGDCYTLIMVEPRDMKPPLFYHTFSPFDVISHKAPDHALVFEDGNLILNTPFTDYITQRTGVMDAAILKALGIPSLTNKKILFIGTGKHAQASLRAIKRVYPELNAVACVNKNGDITTFMQRAKENGIEMERGNLANVGDYDYIFCHATANEPILNAASRKHIKKGAILTSYATETYWELDNSYYDTGEAQVIIDWEQSLKSAKDLSQAIRSNLADPEEIITFHELLTNKKPVNPKANYTLFRSSGTPLQNLAALQLLLKEDKVR